MRSLGFFDFLLSSSLGWVFNPLLFNPSFIYLGSVAIDNSLYILDSVHPSLADNAHPPFSQSHSKKHLLYSSLSSSPPSSQNLSHSLLLPSSPSLTLSLSLQHSPSLLPLTPSPLHLKAQVLFVALLLWTQVVGGWLRLTCWLSLSSLDSPVSDLYLQLFSLYVVMFLL